MQILDYLKARADEERPEVDPDAATAEDYEATLSELGVTINGDNEN